MQPFIVEYITQGLITERSSDGLLNVFVFDSLNPTLLDMLEKHIKTLFGKWDTSQPCLLLYDLHSAQPCLVSAAQAQVYSLLQRQAGLRCYLALVLADDAEAELGSAIDAIDDRRCVTQTFASREEAMLWLLNHR